MEMYRMMEPTYSSDGHISVIHCFLIKHIWCLCMWLISWLWWFGVSWNYRKILLLFGLNAMSVLQPFSQFYIKARSVTYCTGSTHKEQCSTFLPHHSVLNYLFSCSLWWKFKENCFLCTSLSPYKHIHKYCSLSTPMLNEINFTFVHIVLKSHIYLTAQIYFSVYYNTTFWDILFPLNSDIFLSFWHQPESKGK